MRDNALHQEVTQIYVLVWGIHVTALPNNKGIV